MSINLTVNGTVFEYPEVGDSNWGVEATDWATAVTQGMLQKAGGLFSLTAEVDFGVLFGVKSLYYKTETANIATAGQIRLAVSDDISWRNNANSANLDLTLNGSDALTFNGNVVRTGLIVNADVDAAAAIAFSKMAALTISRALVSDGSGVVGVSASTSTEVGFLSGVTSSIQTQLNARLLKAGDAMTGPLILSADPTLSLGAATKSYVDSVGQGLVPHTACRVATTTNGTLATAFENGDTIDGVVLATNDRILIKNQTSTLENGIYFVNASGAPTRALDADTYAELFHAFVFVTAGTAGASTGWACTNPLSGTINVDPVVFVQFSAAGTYSASEQGLTLSGSQFALVLDGGTLSTSGTGLKVSNTSIANAQIAAAAAIAVNKLAALTASRAVVSDGSGFITQATTTAAEIGFVNGVTSAIQTQIDAKIAASVMTTNGDIITRTAGVPARVGIGSTGQSLIVSGGAASWASTARGAAVYEGATYPTAITITPTFTALPISSTVLNFGSVMTRSGDDFTFDKLGYYAFVVDIGQLSTPYTNRISVAVRLRNTTDSTTLRMNLTIGNDASVAYISSSSFFIFEITNISKVYQLQIACAIALCQITTSIIDSELPPLFRLTSIYLGPA